MTRLAPAAKLRSARAALDLTQRAAAKMAGVSQYTIWAIENDKLKKFQLKTAAKIARALNITTDDLVPLSLDDEPQTQTEES